MSIPEQAAPAIVSSLAVMRDSARKVIDEHKHNTAGRSLIARVLFPTLVASLERIVEFDDLLSLYTPSYLKEYRLPDDLANRIYDTNVAIVRIILSIVEKREDLFVTIGGFCDFSDEIDWDILNDKFWIPETPLINPNLSSRFNNHLVQSDTSSTVIAAVSHYQEVGKKLMLLLIDMIVATYQDDDQRTLTLIQPGAHGVYVNAALSFVPSPKNFSEYSPYSQGEVSLVLEYKGKYRNHCYVARPDLNTSYSGTSIKFFNEDSRTMQEYHDAPFQNDDLFPDWQRFPSPTTPAPFREAAPPPFARDRAPSPDSDFQEGQGTHADPVDVDASPNPFTRSPRLRGFSRAPTTPSDPASRERSLERSRADFDMRKFSSINRPTSAPATSASASAKEKGKAKEEQKWDLILHPIFSSTAHCSLIRWSPPRSYEPSKKFCTSHFPQNSLSSHSPSVDDAAELHRQAEKLDSDGTTSPETTSSIARKRNFGFDSEFRGVVRNSDDLRRAQESPEWVERRAARMADRAAWRELVEDQRRFNELEDAEDALIAEEHLKSELPYPDHSPTSSDC